MASSTTDAGSSCTEKRPRSSPKNGNTFDCAANAGGGHRARHDIREKRRALAPGRQLPGNRGKVDPKERVLDLRGRGLLSRGPGRVAQAEGHARACQSHRLDKRATVRQKVHGSILVSVACVVLVAGQ